MFAQGFFESFYFLIHSLTHWNPLRSVYSWIIAGLSIAILLALGLFFGRRRLLRRRRRPMHGQLEENQVYLANLELQMRRERRAEEEGERVGEEEEENVYEEVV